ncbi:MAG: SGNH/GDSL hydrolase family protein [Lachnospiraceae bacterium]|nr:SGNH/GDSL hydrolase family protein [Lachnospiraceae bacterium]
MSAAVALLLTVFLCACGHSQAEALPSVQFESLSEAGNNTVSTDSDGLLTDGDHLNSDGFSTATDTTVLMEQTGDALRQKAFDSAGGNKLLSKQDKNDEKSKTDKAKTENVETGRDKKQDSVSSDIKKANDDKPAEQTQEKPQQTQKSSPAQRRILFVGDSRTIDMFADSDDEISGMNANGIVVYAKHGHGYSYMTGVVDRYGHENFDVLVTWMGANDHGNFSSYEGYYNGLLAEGKTIVVCTVGPTDDETLAEWDHPDYENSRMTAYNASLVQWASQHGVQVIDLYNYIALNVAIDPADGIHYTPRPTAGIWGKIVSSLGQ